MRIIHFSDLHFDKNADILWLDKSLLKNRFIKYLVEIQDTFDMCIFTGDLSNNMFFNIQFCKDLENNLDNKIIKYVPGNHDVSKILIPNGEEIKEINSNQVYDYYLESKYSLKEPFHINENTVLIGGLGWYDYSYVENFLKDVEDKESVIIDYKNTNWFDARRVSFKENDKELTKKENKRYEELFKKYEDKDIFLMNHFIPFYRYTSWIKNDYRWNIANAFMGSAELEELIEKYKNIKYVSFGHTHFRYGKTLIGDRTEICSPLGYVGEWTKVIDYTKTLEEMLTTFINECEEIKIYITIE